MLALYSVIVLEGDPGCPATNTMNEYLTITNLTIINIKFDRFGAITEPLPVPRLVLGKFITIQSVLCLEANDYIKSWRVSHSISRSMFLTALNPTLV